MSHLVTAPGKLASSGVPGSADTLSTIAGSVGLFNKALPHPKAPSAGFHPRCYGDHSGVSGVVILRILCIFVFSWISLF